MIIKQKRVSKPEKKISRGYYRNLLEDEKIKKGKYTNNRNKNM